MPSPLGHAMGGLVFGWLVAGRRGADRLAPRPGGGPGSWLETPTVRQAAVFAGLGMLPDIDFLFGTHNAYTHSVGAALIVGLAATALAGAHRARWGLGAAAAYGSHVLLDWLGRDTSPPIGVMALWPFSPDYYQSDVTIFMAILRQHWREDFLTHNALAVLREVAILGPILALVWRLRVRRGGGTRALER
jgi:inner membrane protein